MRWEYLSHHFSNVFCLSSTHPPSASRVSWISTLILQYCLCSPQCAFWHGRDCWIFSHQSVFQRPKGKQTCVRSIVQACMICNVEGPHRGVDISHIGSRRGVVCEGGLNNFRNARRLGGSFFNNRICTMSYTKFKSGWITSAKIIFRLVSFSERSLAGFTQGLQSRSIRSLGK